MNYTIFDTPVLRAVMRWLSLLILKITGWKVEGQLPDIPKFVIIAAPHTSNWDLPYTLFIAFALKIKIFWMGKDTIFRLPFKNLFKWLGGIPVERSASHNMVARSVDKFKESKNFVLLVPPAGTRKRVLYWKTGFYHIANNADVPIVLGFLDYGRKTGGIGPVVRPTGAMEADMKKIRNFYSNIEGKYPNKSIAYAVLRKD